ncbi:MAG: serine hydrolase domain-containing protein [Maricaulaceae bacterium]
MKKILLFFCVLVLSISTACKPKPAEISTEVEALIDPYATPREEFAVADFKEGFSAEQAYELSAVWAVPKFLDVTASGTYSYVNLAEFLPTSIVRRDGPVSKLETVINKDIGGIGLENENGETLTLDQMINAHDTWVRGVMVLHKGRIVYEAYPGMRRTDNHVWMSNAKILASLLIGQLEEEGKIDVHQTIGTYVPDAKGTAWENISVLDVLNMQSGLDHEETPATRKGDTPYGRFVRAEAGLPNPEGKMETHNQALFAIPKSSEPGKAFEYSSANTQMLGLVIEAITNQRLADVLTDRVWSKAGMVGDATLALSPQGNGIIHGLISSRLEDMAKIGLLYTPSWNKTASDKIVSDNMIQTIQSSGVSENYMKGTFGPRIVNRFGERPVANAYQWDAVFADGDFYKAGMNGQGLYVSPRRDVVVAWFAAADAQIDMEAYARKIATALK